MLRTLWTTIFYDPLYNALVFFAGLVNDAGLAVIILTVIVKILLFPLTKKSILSQAKLRALEGEIEKIKKDYPDKSEQAKKTLELYQKNKVNPFSSCLVILIQLPIIIALYLVFLHGLSFQAEALYSFISYPEALSTEFLGILDLAEKNLILALLAGVTQFVQMKIATTGMKPSQAEAGTFKAEFAKSMQFQMKYILPIFIAFIAYQVSAAIALYWVTSNIVSIIQELLIRRKAGLITRKELFSL